MAHDNKTEEIVTENNSVENEDNEITLGLLNILVGLATMLMILCVAVQVYNNTQNVTALLFLAAFAGGAGGVATVLSTKFLK